MTCLYNDYGDTLTLEDCITKIVSYLCLNHRKYSCFHKTEKPAYAADKLVSDALDFFRSGRFNVDVVDLLMQITCDALKLHLFIYQQNRNQIQVLSFHQQGAEHATRIAISERVICVRFTHDNIHSGGNHYDAITLINPSQPEFNNENLSASNLTPPEMPNEEPYQPIKKRNRLARKKTCSTHSNPIPIFIDLTESDDEIYVPLSQETQKYEIKEEPTFSSYSDTTDNTDSTDIEPFSSSSTPDQFMPVVDVQTKRKRTYSVNTPTTTTTTDSNDEAPYTSGHREIEPELLLQNISHGKPFSTWYFDEIKPQHVSCIPPDITGTGLYKIKTNAGNWSKVTSDLRHFHMLTSSRERFAGQRHIGTCLGSYVCRNTKCPFVLTSKDRVPNKVSWRIPRGRRSIRLCSICDMAGYRESCGTRKLVEYDEILGIATVYHMGDHKCGLQLDINKRNSLIKKWIQERNLSGPTKELSIQEVAKFIEAGSMDLAAVEADCWVDRRAVKRQMD